jgi:hypothetical protein
MKARGISPWKSELLGDELALDQLHGDDGSDEELAGEDEVGSEMEDERSEFDYGEARNTAKQWTVMRMATKTT